MTLQEFVELTDSCEAAREKHESYCSAVNEEGNWNHVTMSAATRLHNAYLALRAQVDAELEAEEKAGL